jgi:hypothetical protein
LKTNISETILDSFVTAKIFLGDKVFEITVNVEIAKGLSKSKLQGKDITSEMTHFMRWYLNDKKTSCSVDIDGTSIPFSLPNHMFDSIEMEPHCVGAEEILIDEFGAILRNMIPSGMRPPTDKQLWFAKKIAFSLDLQLTNQHLKTVTGCSEFIDENVLAFHAVQQSLSEFYKEARLAGRGYIAHSLLSRSTSLDSLPEIMRVSNSETIRKYIDGLSSFLKIFEKLCPKTQELGLITINEMIENSYEFLEIPALTMEEIKNLNN